VEAWMRARRASGSNVNIGTSFAGRDRIGEKP
jgi:hypothetical protein